MKKRTFFPFGSSEFVEYCNECDQEVTFKRLRITGAHTCKFCKRPLMMCSECGVPDRPGNGCGGCTKKNSKFELRPRPSDDGEVKKYYGGKGK